MFKGYKASGDSNRAYVGQPFGYSSVKEPAVVHFS